LKTEGSVPLSEPKVADNNNKRNRGKIIAERERSSGIDVNL